MNKKHVGVTVVMVSLVAAVIVLGLNSAGVIHFGSGSMPKNPTIQMMSDQPAEKPAEQAPTEEKAKENADAKGGDQPFGGVTDKAAAEGEQPPGFLQLQRQKLQEGATKEQAQKPVATEEDQGKESVAVKEENEGGSILPTVTLISVTPDPKKPGCVLVTLEACCECKPKPVVKPKPPCKKPPKRVHKKPAPKPLPKAPGNLPCDKKQGGRLIEVQIPIHN